MAIDLFGPCALGDVRRLTLGHEPGPVLQVLDLGASTNALWLTGGDGHRRDVLLGQATAQERLDSTQYLGASIGRYANRIAGGRLEVDGTAYRLGTNDRGNTLHGGPQGFDRRLWEVTEHSDQHAGLSLVSPDGDQGFPGELVATVTYEVSDDAVRIELGATCDAPTVVNLTNHAYLDLAGEGSGTALEQVLTVPAETFVAIDETGLPLAGPPQPVEHTPLDLRAPTRLADAARTDHPQVRAAHGIDHAFVVDGSGLRLMASLESPHTRTRVELWSDQPAVQVYTGNALDGTLRGTTGRLYRQGDGVALEPGLPPDTPHGPHAGAAVLRPGSSYVSHVEWRFKTLGRDD